MKQSESIILAFSNISDDNLKHLNPELQKIRDVLKDAEEKNYLNIIEHNGVTYNSLSYLLNSGKGKEATMLHFSGHSSKNGLWVQSANEHGIISKKPLTNLIKSHKRFRFVFLNSCYSKDIAQELINAGVPYVIGTSDRVNDEQAAIVAAKFYLLLAKWGKTIEEAFLLTKDYIDDPLNDSDTNIKEAFRTFAILEDTTHEYPWQLYQSAEIKEKDKHWVLNPDLENSKKKRLYISLGTIGIILILVFSTLYFSKIKGSKTTTDSSFVKHSAPVNPDSGKTIVQNSNDSMVGKKVIPTPRKDSKIPSVPIDRNARHETSSSSAKKLFAQLKIVDADRQYNNDITAKVREIFVGKGYLFGDAGADLPAGSYDNLVSGELILSAPVKTNGPFNTVVVDYTVRLVLKFLDGTNKNACGQRAYLTKVSTTDSDTKERVMQQGLDDVLDQLQKDNNFPFCVKK